mmetsp:Transcript_168171/g.540226  ORF Transcript_168171/g.540226 Transcript_168171/m.540226 type:complete len:326 (+) Transcript_168171:1109-2086(+)
MSNALRGVCHEGLQHRNHVRHLAQGREGPMHRQIGQDLRGAAQHVAHDQGATTLCGDGLHDAGEHRGHEPHVADAVRGADSEAQDGREVHEVRPQRTRERHRNVQCSTARQARDPDATAGSHRWRFDVSPLLKSGLASLRRHAASMRTSKSRGIQQLPPPAGAREATLGPLQSRDPRQITAEAAEAAELSKALAALARAGAGRGLGDQGPQPAGRRGAHGHGGAERRGTQGGYRHLHRDPNEAVRGTGRRQPCTVPADAQHDVAGARRRDDELARLEDPGVAGGVAGQWLLTWNQGADVPGDSALDLLVNGDAEFERVRRRAFVF